MKNLFKLFALSFIIVFAFSCKDDELPVPTANFTTDPAVPEVGIPIMFENMTINAASYSWDFGDGSDPSTDISPSHTFDEPGAHTITLTATTQDGQSVIASQEIDIKQRLLTGIFLNLFPFTNGDEDWDPMETNPDSVYADILFQLVNEAGDMGIGIGPIEEVFETPIVTSDLSSAGIFLTDENWSFSIFDFDGADIDNPNSNDYIFMTGVAFNPILAPTVKNEDEDGGYFSIFFVDNSTGNNFIIDFDVTFVLE